MTFEPKETSIGTVRGEQWAVPRTQMAARHVDEPPPNLSAPAFVSRQLPFSCSRTRAEAHAGFTPYLRVRTRARVAAGPNSIRPNAPTR
jgi:hypothetical protein